MSTAITHDLRFSVSEMAENLIGSEIIKLAQEVNEKIKQGNTIYNLTIGDFDPKVFPIPSLLLEEIIKAYKSGETNYPVANGMPGLRKAVSKFTASRMGLNYTADEILIASGARPVIYGIYKTIIDPGDKVIFPVPSWNNNHYCHLSGAEQIMIETQPENNFMPVPNEIEPYLKDATLLALCSPLNPTGTVFSREILKQICEAVAEENLRRNGNAKPLYVLYDQIYWMLTFGNNNHDDPVSLVPALRPYTIYVDGVSKCFAATGIRVGWSFGPKLIIDKMKSILSHVGAWAPRAEQMATEKFLCNHAAVDSFLSGFKEQVDLRLEKFYKGFSDLKKSGFDVDVIPPQAAIYLTVQFNLAGKKLPGGKTLNSTHDVTAYLLEEAKLALVPFSAFGSSDDSAWYRLSVGTCRLEEIEIIMDHLREALAKLKD